MNDWNYTKKGGKIGLIYGLSVLIYFAVIGFLYVPVVYPDTGDYNLHYFLLIIGGFLSYPLVIPLIPFESLYPSFIANWFFPAALFTGAIMGALLGLLMDINEKNKEGGTKKSQREKGVFIRIPFGKSRIIVISERFVNGFIVAEIIVMVFFISLSSSGVTHESMVNGVDGKYLKGGNPTHAIYFNKSTGNFIESSPYDTTENGTYEVNDSLLTLYYSNGKTAEYIVSYDSNALSPANRSQFSSEVEWNENWYLKPMLM